jgi:hypothetical protein
MKALILCLVFSSLFISCKDEPKDDTSLQAGEELNVGDNRALNDDEYTIAINICNAIEDKNIEIQRMVGFSKKFLFKRSKKYCGANEGEIPSFSASLTAPEDFGDIPEFKSGTNENRNVDDFVYKVFVEKEAVIKPVCDKVFSGTRPNLIEPLDSFQVKYRFYGSNKIELAVYMNDSGNWMPYKFDIFNVIINENSDRYGMVYERYSGAYCRNNNDISFTRQILQ